MLMNYLKSILWTSGIIFVSAIIVTILNYFNILNGTVLKIIELIIPIIAIFIGSYKVGKVSNQKGYIEGIKYGAIWFLFLMLVSLILRSLNLGNSIYFLSMIIISMLGSMIGINRKKA